MIRVVEYRREWSALYTAEAAAVAVALGPFCLAVEHIGSTAVPGMAAKPIVDILVGATPGRPPETVPANLAARGYVALGEDARRPGRWKFQKRSRHDFNLSIVPAEGFLWRENLLFRDFLRSSPGARQRYVEAKRQAATAPDAQGYQDRKRAVVAQLKAEAHTWAESGAWPT